VKALRHPFPKPLLARWWLYVGMTVLAKNALSYLLRVAVDAMANQV
jgi:hypothetical protein